MKVLWISVTPSLFDEKKYGGWIASLERIIHKYGHDVELGIAFEYASTSSKIKKNGTTYYPIYVNNSVIDRLIEKVVCNYKWNLFKSKLMEVIEDFQPDIIQCFGSEWPYGLIVQDVDIPVIIHMQGFLNIYHEAGEMVATKSEYLKYNNYNPKVVFTELTNRKKEKEHLDRERQIMKMNRFFMGRTQWDNNIVRYYSPNADYFYCSEALRPEIYDSSFKWKLKKQDKIVLVTISQAGILKGNEIILRTAKLLKEEFNFQFEWRVAGNIGALKMAENKLNINHDNYNIKLLGMIDANSVARELSEATIYIHTAIIDNSPNSLCEAQIMGCPVVAANVGGVSSIVEDNLTGILYPYNEPHTLAFHIMDLCQDKKKLLELSEREKEMAKARHDPKAIFNSLYQIYDTIIQTPISV